MVISLRLYRVEVLIQIHLNRSLNGRGSLIHSEVRSNHPLQIVLIIVNIRKEHLIATLVEHHQAVLEYIRIRSNGYSTLDCCHIGLDIYICIKGGRSGQGHKTAGEITGPELVFRIAFTVNLDCKRAPTATLAVEVLIISVIVEQRHEIITLVHTPRVVLRLSESIFAGSEHYRLSGHEGSVKHIVNHLSAPGIFYLDLDVVIVIDKSNIFRSALLAVLQKRQGVFCGPPAHFSCKIERK